MKLQPGDKIVGTQEHNKGIERVITEARPSGYTWKYPDIPNKDFNSENSNDPLFEWGWEIVH